MHFALKAVHRLGVADVFLVDRLDGDDAFEAKVPGLEDLPHRAFAEPFAQPIRAEDELSMFALEELIDLIRREPIAADEVLGERMAVGIAGHEGAKLIRLGLREELVLRQPIQHLGRRQRSHACSA